MDLHFSIYMGQYWSSQSLSGTETKRKRFELWKLERFPLHRGPELELEPGPPPPHYLASVPIASAAPHLVVDIVGSTLLLRRFLNVICQFRKGSEGYLFQEVCIYRAARAGKNLQRLKREIQGSEVAMQTPGSSSEYFAHAPPPNWKTGKSQFQEGQFLLSLNQTTLSNQNNFSYSPSPWMFYVHSTRIKTKISSLLNTICREKMHNWSFLRKIIWDSQWEGQSEGDRNLFVFAIIQSFSDALSAEKGTAHRFAEVMIEKYWYWQSLTSTLFFFHLSKHPLLFIGLCAIIKEGHLGNWSEETFGTIGSSETSKYGKTNETMN